MEQNGFEKYRPLRWGGIKALTLLVIPLLTAAAVALGTWRSLVGNDIYWAHLVMPPIIAVLTLIGFVLVGWLLSGFAAA